MLTKVVFALIGLLAGQSYAMKAPGGPPHYIMILADDMGFNDIGYTNPEVLTPNMDELARNGLIMNQNYVVHVCSPSRAAFITGRDPFRTAMQHGVLLPMAPHCVPTNVPFLSSALKDGGYQTHLAGKWHLGSCKWGCTPNDRGFDSFLGLLEGGGDHYTHRSFGGFDFRDDTETDLTSIGVYTTELVRDRAVGIIDSYVDGDDPLFMWLTFTAPHTPLQAPESYIALYPDVPEPRKTYLAMISNLDDAVGAIADKLKEKGIWENTFLVFSSDNGGESADGGAASNAPLRGAKGTQFEGGVRVPGFVASPLLADPGNVSDELMYITDFYPTFLSMAGIDYDEDEIDGIDQSEMFLAGHESKRDEIIHVIDIEWTGGFFLGNAAIRQGDMKMIWGIPGESDGYGASVTKLEHNSEYLALINKTEADYTDIPEPRPSIYFISPQETANLQQIAGLIGIQHITREEMEAGRGRVWLFDVIDDPEERTDLSGEADCQDIIEDLKNRIMELIEEDYVAPPAVAFETWFEAANPSQNPNNAWTPGWCESINMDYV